MEEDKILYKEFLKGNYTAFDKIMSLHVDNLVYFIQRYVKNLETAEDIAQDVFVYVLMNKHKYNFNYSLKTYLYIIAKSRALNYIKKNNKIIPLIESLDYNTDEEIEEIVFKNEKIRNLKNSISKLSEENQILIYLADIEELHYKDICKILNKPLSQIKTKIYRARKCLKEIIFKEEEKYYG